MTKLHGHPQPPPPRSNYSPAPAVNQVAQASSNAMDHGGLVVLVPSLFRRASSWPRPHGSNQPIDDLTPFRFSAHRPPCWCGWRLPNQRTSQSDLTDRTIPASMCSRTSLAVRRLAPVLMVPRPMISLPDLPSPCTNALWSA